MARLPSGTTPFMQRPTQRADILALGKTPKRLLKVSGKHFGSQKQANIRNRTPAIPGVRTAFRRDEDPQDNIAGCGAHHWARVFVMLGHEVRLIHAKFVRPFVKTIKNDWHDAAAICEAAQRPTVRFVATKSLEQRDLLAIHRIRERLVSQRIGLCNLSSMYKPAPTSAPIQVLALLAVRSMTPRCSHGEWGAYGKQRRCAGANSLRRFA
jgi:hypothetical protein